MIPLMRSRGMLVVPLKFMCSTQCDTPVSPGPSSAEPTPYQHHTETSGAVWTSWTRIFRPLSRVARRIAVRPPGTRDTVMRPLYKPVFEAIWPFGGLNSAGFAGISSDFEWPAACLVDPVRNRTGGVGLKPSRPGGNSGGDEHVQAYDS